MPETSIGKDRDVFTAIFEFNVDPDQQARMRTELPRIMADVVSKQPGFVSGNLHLSHDGAKVLNYFQWESEAAFRAFRADKETQEQVMAVIGPYGPMPRTYEVAFSVGPGGATD